MWETVERLTGTLKESGLRGLIVLGVRSRIDAIERLAGLVGRDCFLVGDSSVRGGFCRVEVSPARYQRLLGGEAGAGIVSLESMVRPSIVAAVGETVRAGGFLALVGPPWEEWPLGSRDGPGHYKRYLGERIREAPLHVWASNGRVLSARLEPPSAREGTGWDPRSYRSRRGVPRRVIEACRTRDQAVAVEELVAWLRGAGRSVLVEGDRGRGKSYTVGLALAVGVRFRLVGRAAVIGPEPESVESVFQGLRRGLELLGVGYRERRASGGATVRVSGAWFQVSYERPDQRPMAPLAIVDEAAAVGPARVRRIAWRTPKTIVSTTVHGYEGSGKAFSVLLERILPRPLHRVRLETPIRYKPGDPLEWWLYRAFHLRPDPPRVDKPPVRVEHRVVTGGELAGDYRLLHTVYTVLGLAHYRTTPDSLLLLLEAPHHRVHTLSPPGGDPVAVAEVVRETDTGDPRARLALERLMLMAGPVEEEPRLVRVSRIAVIPGLQRRGLGSKLLRRLEEHYRGEGFELVATIFSRNEVAPFWARNGYLLFYVSPRYNRMTGEKNLGYAKPLTPEARPLVERANCAMRRRLLLQAPGIYRDLQAELLPVLLEGPPCPGHHFPLTPGERWRLREFARGRVGYEQAMDALQLHLYNRILSGWSLASLGEANATLVAARVIQGKPLDDAAQIAGVPLEEANERLETVLRELVGEEGGVA